MDQTARNSNPWRVAFGLDPAPPPPSPPPLPPFLALPAEIRNMIYDLLTEEPWEHSQASITKLAQPRRPRRKYMSRARLSWNTSAFRDDDQEYPNFTKYELDEPEPGYRYGSNRQFHGMTQVCRTIRNEFRPLYIDRNEVCILSKDCLKYLQMMWYLQIKGAPVGKSAARVKVPVTRWIPIQPLPVLKYCSYRRTLSVRFFCPRDTGKYHVDGPYEPAPEQPWVDMSNEGNKDLQAMFTDEIGLWATTYHPDRLIDVSLMVLSGMPYVRIAYKRGFRPVEVLEHHYGGRFKFVVLHIQGSQGFGKNWDLTPPSKWFDPTYLQTLRERNGRVPLRDPERPWFPAPSGLDGWLAQGLE